MVQVGRPAMPGVSFVIRIRTTDPRLIALLEDMAGLSPSQRGDRLAKLLDGESKPIKPVKKSSDLDEFMAGLGF